MARRFSNIVNIILAITLIIPWSAVDAHQGVWAVSAFERSVSSSLYRTQVTTLTDLQRERLKKLGIRELSQGSDWTQVLVNSDQLATLARLGYQPVFTNALDQLIRLADKTQPELAAQMQSALSQAVYPTAVRTQDLMSGQQAAVTALVSQQASALASLSNADDDADGLSNTEESWWCTDPLDPDSDNDGETDGQEIQALRDWMTNKRATAPGETPWPSWPFNDTTCPDKDYDSIPNLAELELGLNMDLESTDLDKFDDGQELFGVTACPGGDLNCGYGDLPRSSDSGYVGATMPSWVKAPGNHPLVAAFPKPEIDVVNSSFHVQTVTVVTTDHVISSGSEKSYSTAKTEGTNTSVANTTTWNDWEETSVSNPRMTMSLITTVNQAPEVYDLNSTNSPGTGYKVSGAILGLGAALGTAACAILEPCGAVLALSAGLGLMAAGSTLYGEVIDANSTSENYDPNTPKKVPDQSFTVKPASDGNMVDANSLMCTTQDKLTSSGYTSTSINPSDSKVTTQKTYPISFPVPQTTITSAKGSSYGGALTTTTEEYEEQTVTNGEAFSNEESWGDATAVDAAHAADFWFSYTVKNSGMEYAREIGDLAFNLYIDDDPNPVYTYYLAPDLGGDGLLHNFMPGESHTYTARRIPLTLEQMKAIDLGGTLRVVVEDYTYGADELFYQNAANAGVQIAIEDGTADGDESIDSYLMPVFASDSVLDVIARYFPHTLDENNQLTALWTPEYRGDTPAWCVEPQVLGAGASRAVWCKHALSTADWWNIYTNNLGDGTAPLDQTLAVPGGVALFRFNQDSDLDGYSDRSEAQLGTDPANPADFPKPEVLGGLHSTTNGNNVAATLSLLNTGVYDAYGVEAVMIAPDDSITITNNTVGGSGRVKAGKFVVVGSRVLPAVLGSWTGSAQPSSSGYYTGTVDRSYSFTVVCSNPGGCDVGTGTWNITWSDGQGNTGSLNYGDGYASPTALLVGTYGLQVGLVSGRVFNGNTFAVDARTPRDTFQYTINSEPHSQPVVVVSYNDPQGNHRFILPESTMNLSVPTESLVAFSGQMLQDPGVEIVTTQAFSEGANSTSLVVNNPSGQSLVDAHLFMDFIDPDGNVVHEVSATQTLPEGPSVVDVDWNSADFTTAYDPAQDYIVLVFWTDLEGNILDTAGRPLSSFQEDPKPTLAMADNDTEWNFGTAVQGTLLKRNFSFANTGQQELLTYVEAPSGISVSQTGSQSVGPADLASYEMNLNTAKMTLGDYDQTITIHTSDPAKPTRPVHVTGTVTEGTPDSDLGSLQRPLDFAASIAGSHSQGEQVEFTHDLGPDPQSLQPVKVYSQDYSQLWGVGKYATDFGTGTLSNGIFGDGSDEVFSGGDPNEVRSALSGNANSGQNTLTVTDSTNFEINQEVLIIQMQGTSAGNYEFGTIASKGTGFITLQSNLKNSYYQDGYSKAQVLRVPHFTTVTGMISTGEWNGSNGGIVVFRAQSISGATINVSGLGFKGGYGNNTPRPPSPCTGPGNQGQQGSSPDGNGGCSRSSLGGGGGAAVGDFGSGGGGGYGSNGANGGGQYWGSGGLMYGSPDLSTLYLGSGGGGGSWGTNPYGGGRATIQGDDHAGQGAGTAFIAANIVNGMNIFSNGNNGGNSNGNYGGYAGGGGSGGSINLILGKGSLGSLQAVGGTGGDGTIVDGGNGGNGRIYIESCEPIAYSSNPTANTQHLSCFIVDQEDIDPYTTTRLNLPESFSDGQTYAIQYGRKADFDQSGDTVTTLRVPAGLFSSVTLDSLISEVNTGSLTFDLDIGNHGAWDWSSTSTVTGSTTLSSPDLSAAFNAYWISHGAPSSGTIDVPVRVHLDQSGQVLLTNLQVTGGSSKLRYLRLPANAYENVTFTYTLDGGSGATAVAIDVGDDGSIDTTWSSSPSSYPVNLTSQDLSSAINAYLAGRSGEVDIPIRFFVSPDHTLSLEHFSASPANKPDAGLTNADVILPGNSPVEGETISISATLHNSTGQDTGGVTAAFFAAIPDWGDWYLGSALIGNIPGGGEATASLDWNTLGFTGELPVKVEVDPYNRLTESMESNNQASATLTILTRPDLAVSVISPSNPEPQVGQTIEMSIVQQNMGQTGAGASQVSLYDGNPSQGGVKICDLVLGILSGGQDQTGNCSWTPNQMGKHRVFALSDSSGVVPEGNESNNQTWQDIYVGLVGPVDLDSGGTTSQDPAYSISAGYGYLDPENNDKTVSCSIPVGQETRIQTLRKDPGGDVAYQFDYLLPGHNYHLDLLLYECDGAGRQESVYINNTLLQGPVDLGDGKVHRLSLRLDPALYAGHTIKVDIKAQGQDGAVIAAVNLVDIDYRYSDSGGDQDPQYSSESQYGWLNGISDTSNGTIPYQSVRINQDDNTLDYQYDGLDANKQYKLHLSFWQPSGTPHQEKILLDGADSGRTIDTGDYLLQKVTLTVPLSTYQVDGSLLVSVIRTNASTGVILNEIALEEVTLPEPLSCDDSGVNVTPYFSETYGNLSLFNLPVEIGEAKIEALTPRGNVVGCFVVDTTGQYGLMRIYGEDTTTQPAIDGMRAGERVTFRVNGMTAFANPADYWQNDHAAHNVDLTVQNLTQQSVALAPGWNLLGFGVEPPSPLIELLLGSAQSRTTRVIGETGVYAPGLDDVFVTLKELHANQGYYFLLNGSTNLNLQFSGQTVPPGTVLTLHQGWNWIGGPDSSIPVADALASISGKFKRVLSLDQTYDPSLPSSFSTLKNLSPGVGYLIYATDEADLIYPSVSGEQFQVQSEEESMNCKDITPTPALMLVYGQVKINGSAAPTGYRVEILTPRGELAGCGVVGEDGILPLTHVYGMMEGSVGFQDGEVLHFTVNGLPAVVNQDLSWIGDKESYMVELNTDSQSFFLPLITH